jgi:ABC-type antimicrobial peptide transport system permease subunit
MSKARSTSGLKLSQGGEMGIRLALGGTSQRVLRSVLGDAMRIAAAGVAIGVAAAVGITRVLRALLFGIDPADPRLFVLLAASIGGVALLAAYGPARRATRIDPVETLRHE